MKKSITYVLLSILFLCLCLPLGGCENNLEEYKDEKRTEITEYAEKKIAENGYTKEALQRIEKCVQEGKEKIIDGEKKKDVDTFVMKIKESIDSIESFKIVSLYLGTWDGVLAKATFHKEFLDENRTYGMYYLNEDYDPEDSSSQQVLEDTSSPKCRTHIITEQSQLEKAYIDSPEVDWEREMVVMFFYTIKSNYRMRTKSVWVEESILHIDTERIDINTGNTGYQTSEILHVFKLDKLNVMSLEVNVVHVS